MRLGGEFVNHRHRPLSVPVVYHVVAVMWILAPVVSTYVAPVDALIKSEMEKLHIPGLSLAVVKDRKIVKLAGYGFANLETRTPATPDTAYKIASLSKPIFGMAISLLVQEGKVGFEDKIGKYLERVPETWKEITVRHVLTHTSGIPRDPVDYHPYQAQKPMAVIASAYALPLQFQPGERFLYSNVGYYVLAEVIEKASGEPWGAYIQRRLLGPAGLTDTQLLTDAVVPNRASGYDENHGKLVNAENWIAARPSAAFLSTAHDLARWDIFLDTRNPLAGPNWDGVRKQTPLKDGRMSEYGAGWYVGSYLGRRRVHHDGQYPGFRSDYERFEQDKVTVIFLTNAGRPRVDGLALKIAGYYAPTLATPKFVVQLAKGSESAKVGVPTSIPFSIKVPKRAAPGTVLEMEIWDADNKTVNKQSRFDQDFAKGETKQVVFGWKPETPGKYWINLGIYGPGFAPNYHWAQHIGALTVESSADPGQ